LGGSYRNDPSSRADNSQELSHGGEDIGNELECAHHHDGVEGGIGERKSAGRNLSESSGGVVRGEFLAYGRSRRVYVDAVEMVTVARQFGEDDATAVTDFEYPLDAPVPCESCDGPQPEALDPPQERSVVPVSLVERVGFHEVFSGKQSQFSSRKKRYHDSPIPGKNRAGGADSRHGCVLPLGSTGEVGRG